MTRHSKGRESEQEAGIGMIYTEALPAGAFYRADDCHQKYHPQYAG